MNEIKALEYSLLKVPYDSLNKIYRNTQKDIDRDNTQIHTLCQKMSQHFKAMSSSTTQEEKEKSLKLIEEMKKKFYHLEKHVSDGIESQREKLDTCRLRTQHLLEYAKICEIEKAEGEESLTQKKDEWQQNRLNRMLVDYYLRMGHFETATTLTREAEIEHLVDTDIFLAARKIEQALHDEDTAPCLAWCHNNKTKLKKMNSTLEFNLRLQQFVELIKSEKRQEAVNYAKKYFNLLDSSYLSIIQRAMGLLAQPINTTIPRYQTLFSSDRWEQLVLQFRSENFSILQMSPTPLFTTTIAAGLIALKTPHCYDSEKKNKECPVCSPHLNKIAEKLPRAMVTRSRLLCRLTNLPMNENNPPLALPNGQVYSDKGIRDILNPDNTFTCPVTKDVFNLDLCKKVFIM